jgi:hypothetical protein
MLHLSAWVYKSDTITLQGLNHQVNRILQNTFGSYFYNSIVNLFQVSLLFSMMKKAYELIPPAN